MSYRRLPTKIPDLALIEPEIHGDERGFLSESYRRDRFAALGIGDDFVQENHSRSRHGIVRGMHFQVGRGIAKLVRCARGAIFDVVVDVRRGSPTFGEWEAFELTGENLHQLYCPIGFAHGFCVMSDVADVLYRQTGYYDPELERGIAYDDPDLGIEWPLPPSGLFPSARDAVAPRLSEAEPDLPFRYPT